MAERMSEFEEEENMANIMGIIQKRSCTDCDHFRVCKIYVNIAAFIQSITIEGMRAPIDINTLASLCLEYTPLVTKSQVRKNRKHVPY